MIGYRFHLLRAALATAVLVAPAVAQRNQEPRFEFGASGGGSFYQTKTISGPGGSAEAKFDTNISAAAGLTHNMYPKLAGEVRYEFANNDMKLSSGSTSVGFSGQSHAVHYDLVVHATKLGSKVRPYVFAGAGAKLFRGTGEPSAFQGLNRIAVFTQTSQTTFVGSFGAGVKFAISPHLLFRMEIRDNMSQFPSKVITPASGDDFSAWIHNILPMFGVSYIF